MSDQLRDPSNSRTVPIKDVLGEDWELPEGFHWEYMDGEDGGGGVTLTESYHWPSTRYRRAVSPWEVHRPGGPAQKVTIKHGWSSS